MINYYPWAVYCESPPSFIWGEGGAKNEGLLYLQSTIDIHILNMFRLTVGIHFKTRYCCLYLCCFALCCYQTAKARTLCVYYNWNMLCKSSPTVWNSLNSFKHAVASCGYFREELRTYMFINHPLRTTEECTIHTRDECHCCLLPTWCCTASSCIPAGTKPGKYLTKFRCIRLSINKYLKQ